MAVWKKYLLEGDAGGLPTPICITLWMDVAFAAWTNMPAAETEFRAVLNTRNKVDLTLASQARIVVCQGAALPAAGAKLKVQWSTNYSTWYDLCEVTLISGTASQVAVGAWTAVGTAAGDKYIRLVGISGDGVADPNFGLITLQVK